MKEAKMNNTLSVLLFEQVPEAERLLDTLKGLQE